MIYNKTKQKYRYYYFKIYTSTFLQYIYIYRFLENGLNKLIFEINSILFIKI